MRHGIVLFTCDRGITPAQAARAAEERGFDTFYVPEHTHIPVKREAAHPRTGDGTLPDDRYSRTLDPPRAISKPGPRPARPNSSGDCRTPRGRWWRATSTVSRAA
jgi:hypothetical protein